MFIVDLGLVYHVKIIVRDGPTHVRTAPDKHGVEHGRERRIMEVLGDIADHLCTVDRVDLCTSTPSIVIDPEAGARISAMVFISVDFPDPFGPRSASTSPDFDSKLMSLRTA